MIEVERPEHRPGPAWQCATCGNRWPRWRIVCPVDGHTSPAVEHLPGYALPASADGQRPASRHYHYRTLPHAEGVITLIGRVRSHQRPVLRYVGLPLGNILLGASAGTLLLHVLARWRFGPMVLLYWGLLAVCALWVPIWVASLGWGKDRVRQRVFLALIPPHSMLLGWVTNRKVGQTYPRRWRSSPYYWGLSC